MAPQPVHLTPFRFPRSWLWENWERLLDFAVYNTGSIATKALSMFAQRRLFPPSERRGGRGVEPRSAFMGYVAVSQARMRMLLGV